MLVGRIILGALSLFLVFGTGSATNCTTWSTSNPEVDTDPLGVLGEGMRWYFDNDLCQPECTFSMWLYQESNGIPGLQRGDEVVDDTCHGMIEADTIACKLLPMAILAPARPRSRKERAVPAVLAGALVLGAVAALPTAEAC